MLLISGYRSVSLVYFETVKNGSVMEGKFSLFRKIEIPNLEFCIFGLSQLRNEVVALGNAGEKMVHLEFENNLDEIK